MFSNALTGFLRRNPSARILADLRTPEGLRKMTGAGVYAGVSVASTEKWLRENAESAKAIGRALKRAMQWVANHRPEESWARMSAEYRSQDMEADLEAIRYGMLDLNPDGATTLEMARATQRTLAVSIPEVVSLDIASTFTNEFLDNQ